MWQLDIWVTKLAVKHKDFLIMRFGDWVDVLIEHMAHAVMYYELEKEFVTVKPYCYITSPFLFYLVLEKAKDKMTLDELRTLNEVSSISVALLRHKNAKGYDEVLNAIRDAKRVYKMSAWERHYDMLESPL
jgi:hypothetical protein